MKNRISMTFIIFIFVIVLIIGSIFWETSFKKTYLIVEDSPDNDYQLVIFEVGEAPWPFGSSTCSIQLNKGSSKLSDTIVKIGTDGGYATSDLFLTEWCDEYVAVDVKLLELGPSETYKLYFNGDVIKGVYIIEGLRGTYIDDSKDYYLTFDGDKVTKNILNDELIMFFKRLQTEVEVHGFEYVWLHFPGEKEKLILRYDESSDTLINVNNESDVFHKVDDAELNEDQL